MASEFQVQYLDSENKLVKRVITSNSSSEVERSIKDLDGDVLSIVEKKSPSFNIVIGELVKLQEKTNFIQHNHPKESFFIEFLKKDIFLKTSAYRNKALYSSEEFLIKKAAKLDSLNNYQISDAGFLYAKIKSTNKNFPKISKVIGLFIALGVNSLPQILKGPTIFMSLLPMIVTPLIGALILFWMTDAEGIIGSTLQRIFNDSSLSLKASKPLTWVMLMVYGIWGSIPFSFIVFYAGLQTVPEDTLEAAMIDGANRWQRIWYVVIPYIMPLVVFITLILLMDNFRVFEPIIGFSAQANATSLSWIIYNDLRGGEIQYFGSASATSMLTIIGVGVLLVPILIRTWRDFNSKTV